MDPLLESGASTETQKIRAPNLALNNLNKNIKLIKEHKLQSLLWDDDKKIFHVIKHQNRESQIEGFNQFIKSISVNENDNNNQLIAELFFEILPKKDKKHTFFKRDHIPKEIIEMLADYLEKNLNPPKKRMVQTSLKIARVWAKMGNVIQSTSGSSISYQIYAGDDPKRNKLGIFKPARMEPLAKDNKKLSQRVKKLAVAVMPQKMVGSLWETTAGQGFVGEKVASVISDQIIGFVSDYLDVIKNTDPDLAQKLTWQLETGLVPKTDIGTIDIEGQEEHGSFQEWFQHQHQEAYEFLGFKNKNFTGLASQKSKIEIPDELFELLVILDYLTGNSDRHGENWFVAERQGGDAAAVIPIDGGWSMAPEAPLQGAIELGNQYKWGKLKLADKQFSDFGKKIIKDLIDSQDKLKEKILDLYNENLTDPKNQLLNERRIAAMSDRIAVLKTFAESDKTKKELSQIRTQEEIMAITHPEYLLSSKTLTDTRNLLSRIFDLFHGIIGEVSFALKRVRNRQITEEQILKALNNEQPIPMPYDVCSGSVPPKTWKKNSECLQVFIHGLSTHPSDWDAHITALEQSHKNDQSRSVDTLIPFVYRKGQCSLEEAAAPILWRIKQYRDEHPNKPIILSGFSNGGALVLYLAQELKKTEPQRPIMVTTIAAPLLGTQASSKIQTAQKKLKKYNSEVQERLAFGSTEALKLLDSTPKDVQILCYGGREDMHVTPLASAVPSIEGAERRVISGVMHHSILDHVAEEHIEATLNWVDSQKSTE